MFSNEAEHQEKAHFEAVFVGTITNFRLMSEGNSMGKRFYINVSVWAGEWCGGNSFRSVLCC